MKHQSQSQKLTSVNCELEFTKEQLTELHKRFSFMPEMGLAEKIKCLLFLWLDDSTVVMTTAPTTTVSYLIKMTKRIKELEKAIIEEFLAPDSANELLTNQIKSLEQKIKNLEEDLKHSKRELKEAEESAEYEGESAEHWYKLFSDCDHYRAGHQK